MRVVCRKRDACSSYDQRCARSLRMGGRGRTSEETAILFYTKPVVFSGSRRERRRSRRRRRRSPFILRQRTRNNFSEGTGAGELHVGIELPPAFRYPV